VTAIALATMPVGETVSDEALTTPSSHVSSWSPTTTWLPRRLFL
jgi:hypothetical protein